METTFALVAHYQYRENYGAHQWDGEGECPQYWKNKGGSEVVVRKGITVAQASEFTPDDYEDMVSDSDLGHGEFNDYVEYIYLGYDLVEISGYMIEELRTHLLNAGDDGYSADLGYLRYNWKYGQKHFDLLADVLKERGELTVEGSPYLYQTFEIKEAA